MSRSFVIFVIVGIVALGIFSYFVFGLNQKPSTDTTQMAADTNAQHNTQTITAAPAGKLKVEDLKIGSGEAVKSGDNIVINYVGTLTNGTKFDSSYDRGQPFETQIGVGKVIKGWDQGVVGMRVGGKRRLTIPPSLGYGDQAAGSIPPNSTLIFEVELMGIK